MKKVLTTLLLLLSATLFWAQPSSQINLQAVARTTGGAILNNKTITLKISLLEGTATGTPVWVEQTAVTTNQFGLFNYAIGSGTPVGAFTYVNVDWSTKKFVQLEIDPAGGLNFVTLSTDELKSVPFANTAKSALSLKLPLDQTTPDNGPANTSGLTIRSNIADGMAGVTTKKDKSGVYGLFTGDANNTTGTGLYGAANKDGNGVAGINMEKGTFGILGHPIYSGFFSGSPVLIDNRKQGVSLQLAGARHTFMELYPNQVANPGIRRAVIGFPGDDLTYLLLQNEFPNGNIAYRCGTGGIHDFQNSNMFITAGGLTVSNGNIIAKSGGLAYCATNVGGDNAGLEIHATGSGSPYIDFALSAVDYHMRLGLAATNNLLLQGGGLQIDGITPRNMSYAFYTKNSNNTPNTGAASETANPLSLYASQRIAATEFNAFSDKRIKKDFLLSRNDKDLSTLSKLEVTDYRHIDFVTKGEAYKIGFIAQQVEQIYPEAVSKSKDFIPNVYLPATKATVQNETLRIDMAKDIALVKGDKVRFYVKDKMHESEVADIILPGNETEGLSFTINNWKNGDVQEVFVYGKEVNDFRAVDYDRIFTLNVSATQELIKRNEDLTKRVIELEKQKQGLENGIKNLDGKVSDILKRLNTEGLSTTAEINSNSSTPKTMSHEK